MTIIRSHDGRPICVPTVSLVDVIRDADGARVLCPACGAAVAVDVRGDLSDVPDHPHRFG